MATPNPATTEWVPLYSPTAIQGPAGPPGPPGASGSGISDAQYWVSVDHALLSADRNLGALASGYLKITTTAGVATPSSVTTLPIADLAVSASPRLLGRSTVGPGAAEELTLGNGLAMSGTVLNAHVAGSGTGAYLTKWVNATTIGNSIATDNGATIFVAGNLQLQSGQPALYLYESSAPADARYWRIVCAGGVIWFQGLSDSGGAQVTPLQVQRDHINIYGQTQLFGNAGQWSAIMYADTTANASNGMVIYGGSGVNDNALYVMNRAANVLGLQIRGDMSVYVPTGLVVPVGANKWVPS